MWNCFNVFINGPFFSICSMSIVFSIVLYVCCAYLEFGLFVLSACMCSLYLVLKFLPVCPKYSRSCPVRLGPGYCLWYTFDTDLMGPIEYDGEIICHPYQESNTRHLARSELG
jgi:hypothetical protein